MPTAYGSTYANLGTLKSEVGKCWRTGTIRAWFSYAQTAITQTNVQITFESCGAQIGSGANCRTDDDYHFASLFVTGAEASARGLTVKSLIPSSWTAQEWKPSGFDNKNLPYYNGGASKTIGSFRSAIDIPRTHSAQTVTLSVEVYALTGLGLSPINASPYAFNAGTPLKASATVTIPAKPSYTVSYNPVGGSSVASQTKWWGENLTLSTTRPTRLGYIFKGWATSATGSVAYQPGAVYTANAPLILYAVWEPVYTVKYDLNGHGVPSAKPADQTKNYNVDLKLSTVVPQPESVVWTFLGWATFNGAIAPQYQPGDVYSTNASATLYAVWQQNVDTELTLAHVNRVYPDSEDIIDDTSEFIRVTAQLYVESIWQTSTRVSITSERSDGVKGPSAVTILPSSALDKPEETPALNHQIVWRSHTDDLRFLEDWQYNIHIQADTYKVENQPGEVNSSLALPNPFGDRMEADAESRTLDAALIPGNCYAVPTPFEVTDENSIDACVIFAHREFSTLEDGSLEIVLTKPANPTPRAYIKPGTGIEIQYTVSRSSEDENGNPNIEVFTDSISVNIPNLPRTIPHGSEQLVFEVAMPELPEDAVVDSVRINSPSVMLEPNPVKAVLDVSNTDDLITVTVGYPEDISGKTVYIPEQYNSVDFLEREASGPLVYSAATDILLTSAEFIMDFHKDGHGAGIGRKAPERGLDVGWKTKFYEAVEAAKELVVKGATTLKSLTVEGGATLKSTLDVVGDMKTGNISLVHGSYPKISRPGSSTSWISGHKIGSVVQTTTAPSNSSYSGMLSMATEGGNWSIGVFRNNLSFSYITNGNLNSNQNVAHCVHMAPNPAGDMYLQGAIQKNSYWGITAPDGTDTSYIRTPANGLLPHSSNANGTSVVGTSGWPFREIHCAKFINLSGVDLNSSKTLWSGMFYMTAGHTATLSQARSAQPNGIILIFRVYNSGSPYGQVSWFVPNAINGNTYFFCTSEVFGSIGAKVLGIWNTSITGNDNNIRSATKNGITYNNAAYVLTQVIGV